MYKTKYYASAGGYIAHALGGSFIIFGIFRIVIHVGKILEGALIYIFFKLLWYYLNSNSCGKDIILIFFVLCECYFL
jgi:hypothetical protein